MKKRVLVFALVIFFAGANIVFADANFSTVKQDGWADTSTFAWNEKPWLHINVTDNDVYDNWAFAYWNYPAVGASYLTSNYFNFFTESVQVGTNDLYMSFKDSFWSGIRKTGEWNVSAATVLFKSTGEPYFWTTLQPYNGNVSFNITPEPVSSVLFLLGAGALASRSLLKKKRKAI